MKMKKNQVGKIRDLGDRVLNLKPLSSEDLQAIFECFHEQIADLIYDTADKLVLMKEKEAEKVNQCEKCGRKKYMANFGKAGDIEICWCEVRE